MYVLPAREEQVDELLGAVAVRADERQVWRVHVPRHVGQAARQDGAEEERDDGVGAGAREEPRVLLGEGDGVGEAALLVQGQRLGYAIVSAQGGP